MTTAAPHRGTVVTVTRPASLCAPSPAPSGRRPWCVAVEPSPRNGLRKPSQLMVDNLFTVPNQSLGDVMGQLEPDGLPDLALALQGWLELP